PRRGPRPEPCRLTKRVFAVSAQNGPCRGTAGLAKPEGRRRVRCLPRRGFRRPRQPRDRLGLSAGQGRAITPKRILQLVTGTPRYRKPAPPPGQAVVLQSRRNLDRRRRWRQQLLDGGERLDDTERRL